MLQLGRHKNFWAVLSLPNLLKDNCIPRSYELYTSWWLPEGNAVSKLWRYLAYIIILQIKCGQNWHLL